MDLYTVRSHLQNGKSVYDLPLRVVFYARVSTEKDEQTHSLKAQIEYYRGYITDNQRWQLIDGYIDEGVSGTSVCRRADFMRMLEDAKKGRFDFIITKEISRFSRNTLDSIRYTQELLQHGVGVFFQSDNINTFMPDAELRLTIMSSIAQDEVRKISERVRFGFQRSIEKGVVLGNNNIWGYKKDNGRLVIEPEEAEVVRDIFQLYATENIGIRRICGYLSEKGVRGRNGNALSFSTVKNILQNPKYMGYYCGNKTHKCDYKLKEIRYLDREEWVLYKDENKVPPIVPEEIWRKANRILEGRSREQKTGQKTSYQNKYTYSGKIYCMEHGAPYYRGIYKYKSGTREVWQCKYYAEKGKTGCASPVVYTDEMDMLLHEACQAALRDKERLAEELTDVYREIGMGSKAEKGMRKMQQEMERIGRMKQKLLQLVVENKLSDDEFMDQNNRLSRESDRLKEGLLVRKDAQEKNREILLNERSIRNMILDELHFRDGFDNMVADSLLEKIEVRPLDNEGMIKLSASFKVFGEKMECSIRRRKGRTSVCSISYI